MFTFRDCVDRDSIVSGAVGRSVESTHGEPLTILAFPSCGTDLDRGRDGARLPLRRSGRRVSVEGRLRSLVVDPWGAATEATVLLTRLRDDDVGVELQSCAYGARRKGTAAAAVAVLLRKKNSVKLVHGRW